MKKFIKNTLIFFCLSFFMVSISQAAGSTAILNNTAALGDLTSAAAQSAHFGDMSLGDILALIIQIVLGFLGTVFIILMIISGFRWMTAAGNEEQVTKATDTIRAAVIGLILVMAAYAITYYVLYYLPFSGGGGSMGNATNS